MNFNLNTIFVYKNDFIFIVKIVHNIIINTHFIFLAIIFKIQDLINKLFRPNKYKQQDDKIC